MWWPHGRSAHSGQSDNLPTPAQRRVALVHGPTRVAIQQPYSERDVGVPPGVMEIVLVR